MARNVPRLSIAQCGVREPQESVDSTPQLPASSSQPAQGNIDLSTVQYLFATDQILDLASIVESYTCPLCKEEISMKEYINHLDQAKHMKLLYDWLLCCKNPGKYKTLITKLRGLNKVNGMFCEICKKASFSVKDLSAYKTHLKSQKHEDCTQALIEKFNQTLSALNTAESTIVNDTAVAKPPSQDLTTGSTQAVPSLQTSESSHTQNYQSADLSPGQCSSKSACSAADLVKLLMYSSPQSSKNHKITTAPDRKTTENLSCSNERNHTQTLVSNTQLEHCKNTKNDTTEKTDQHKSTINHGLEKKELQHSKAKGNPDAVESINLETRLSRSDEVTTRKRSRSPSNDSLESGEIRDSRSPSWSPDRLASERLSPVNNLTYRLADALNSTQTSYYQQQRLSSSTQREQRKFSPPAKKSRYEKSPSRSLPSGHYEDNHRKYEYSKERRPHSNERQISTEYRTSLSSPYRSYHSRESSDNIHRTPAVLSTIIVPQSRSSGQDSSNNSERKLSSQLCNSRHHSSSTKSRKDEYRGLKNRTSSTSEKNEQSSSSSDKILNRSLSSSSIVHRVSTNEKLAAPTRYVQTRLFSKSPSSDKQTSVTTVSQTASGKSALESLSHTPTSDIAGTSVNTEKGNQVLPTGNHVQAELSAVKDPSELYVKKPEAGSVSHETITTKRPHEVSLSKAHMDKQPASKSELKRRPVSPWTLESMSLELQDKWNHYSSHFYCKGVRDNTVCLKFQAEYLRAYKGFFVEDPKLEVIFHKLKKPEKLKASIEGLPCNKEWPLPTFQVLQEHVEDSKQSDSFIKSEPKNENKTPNDTLCISDVDQLQLNIILAKLRERLDATSNLQLSPYDKQLLQQPGKDPFVQFIHHRMADLLKITLLQDQMDAKQGGKDAVLQLMNEKKRIHEEMITPEGHLLIRLSRCCISKSKDVLYSYPNVSRSALDTLVLLDKYILQFLADTPTLTR